MSTWEKDITGDGAGASITYSTGTDSIGHILNTLIGYGLIRQLMANMKETVNSESFPIKDIIDQIDIDKNITDYNLSKNWNKSVVSLSEKVDKFLSGDADYFNGQVNLATIKEGNAGLNFTGGTETEYVQPNSNLSEGEYHETYRDEVNTRGISGVRVPDSIRKDLTLGNYLDFTEYYKDKGRDTTPELNLLMPQYNRQVRVEDLDRNFWVISQVMSGLSKILFSPDGLKGIFKDLITEIAHLWSTVALLWLGVEASEPADYDVYYDFVTLSNNNFMHMTYDYPNGSTGNHIDINTSIVGEIGEDREKLALDSLLDAAIAAHPNSHICLLAEIRHQHYQDNCYSEVSYKLCLYNRFYGKRRFVNIVFNKGKQVDSAEELEETNYTDKNFYIGSEFDQSSGEVITSQLRAVDFKKVTMAFKKVNRTLYSYKYPFSSLSDMEKEWDYMLAIRILPKVIADFSNKNFITINLSFTFEDAGWGLINGIDIDIDSLEKSITLGEMTANRTLTTNNSDSTTIEVAFESSKELKILSQGASWGGQVRPQAGCFPGELLTCIYYNSSYDYSKDSTTGIVR